MTLPEFSVRQTVLVNVLFVVCMVGGFGALARLRSMARRPQMVVSGAGDVFGRWVIEEVANEQTYQDRFGRPAKITFSVKLKRYGDDGGFGFSIF